MANIKLIKNITGSVYEPSMGDIYFVKSISGVIGVEDYIKVYNFTAYLQNLTKADFTGKLIIPVNFGLQNQRNIEPIILNVNY